MKIKVVSPYVFFLCVAFCAFMLYDLFSLNIFLYADEITGVICFLGIVLVALIRKHNDKNLYKWTFNIFLLLALMIILGIAGNIFSSIKIEVQWIGTEAFVFVKQYLIFCFLLMTLSSKMAKQIFSFCYKISRVMIVSLAMLAAVNSAIGIGLTGTRGEFSFMAHFGGTVSVWIFLFMCIVLFSDSRRKKLYFALSTFVILLSESGLGILGIGLTVAVYIFLVKQKKFKWYYLIVIVPFMIAISYEEISTYLLDQTAPRALLLMYGFVTANRFFPFGAGFSTYASAGAANRYSQLYNEYGFNVRHGMTKDNPLFLMDSYYPRIMGELGYVGVLLFGLLIYIIVKKLIFTIEESRKRSYALLLITFLLAAGIGFGTGGSWGCAVYMILAVMIYLGNVNSAS